MCSWNSFIIPSLGADVSEVMKSKRGEAPDSICKLLRILVSGNQCPCSINEDADMKDKEFPRSTLEIKLRLGLKQHSCVTYVLAPTIAPTLPRLQHMEIAMI